MESIKTSTRIHPLIAAAAVSVVIVSLAGTAAITGLLPVSHGAPAAQLGAVAPAPMMLAAAPMPLAAAPMPLAAAPMQFAVAQQQQYSAEPAPAPVVRKAPVVKRAAPRPRVVHHYHPQVARNDRQQNYRAPAVEQAPQPAQPNYVAIGMGAVVGGLLGNQVGSGNGRKAATVAGLLGGGYVGNEIANRNK